MKIIENRFIPFQQFYAVNILGLVFVRKGIKLNKIQRNHEYIHTLQQREMLFVGFYLWYITEWLIRLPLCRNLRKSYFSISFEKEAYAHERDKGYRHCRSRFAWFKYL